MLVKDKNVSANSDVHKLACVSDLLNYVPAKKYKERVHLFAIYTLLVNYGRKYCFSTNLQNKQLTEGKTMFWFRRRIMLRVPRRPKCLSVFLQR